ncbi:MAG: formylmethanofuran dehydrogenase subunit E family protein [Pirellulales bacterium]|nr:formylmethanofuran dehydrogenase subunit E family protein [Pirellulales bacterium]
MRVLPVFTILLSVASSCYSAEETMCSLPKPHYHRDASDPEWLAYAAQFHGHLGPWAAAGLRAGMAARCAVKADGYFDVDVTVEGPLVKPPHSCFLDGLQVSTGATLGKRNLNWLQAEKVVVRVRNTGSGQVVEVRPTDELIKLLASVKTRPKTATAASAHGRDEDHADLHFLEGIARWIATMPEKRILTVTFPKD